MMMIWWVASLGANICIAVQEYLYRSATFDSFLGAVPFLIPLNLAVSFCLFHSYRGAPSLMFAWAFLTTCNMALRLLVAHYVLGEAVTMNQLMGVLLMFVGPCAGSTGGGMKVIRVLLVARSALLDIRRTFQPHDVLTVKVGGRAVSSEILSAVVSFVSLFVGVWALGALALALLGLDPVTAASASVAALGNVGPALGAVGPESNYGGLPAAAKLLLTLLMLLGRLELFTVLTLLSRRLWRR